MKKRVKARPATTARKLAIRFCTMGGNPRVHASLLLLLAQAARVLPHALQIDDLSHLVAGWQAAFHGPHAHDRREVAHAAVQLSEQGRP